MELNKVICPHCGYQMPVFYTPESMCKLIYVRCKGRNCKQLFEIKLTGVTDKSVINNTIN